MVRDFEGAVPELGSFELQIMLAILMLGDGTYGAPVYEKVEEIAGKRINQAPFTRPSAEWRGKGCCRPRRRIRKRSHAAAPDIC
jgi:hypothetical protein